MSLTPSLFQKHYHLGADCARSYYAPGMEHADLAQEGRVALWNAARTFKPELGVPFPQWAKLVIHRRLIHVVRSANAQCHRLLSDSLREVTDGEGVTHYAHELLSADPGGSAEDMAIRKAELQCILHNLQRLTEKQQRAVVGTAIGITYHELDANPKSVDNALQKGRNKLRRTA